MSPSKDSAATSTAPAQNSAFVQVDSVPCPLPTLPQHFSCPMPATTSCLAQQNSASIGATLPVRSGDVAFAGQPDTAVVPGTVRDGLRSGTARASPGRRTEQREKQIEYGYNTIGYQNFRLVRPRNSKIRRGDPVTPDKNNDCSTRSWAGQIKRWRKLIHKWDSPVPAGLQLPPGIHISFRPMNRCVGEMHEPFGGASDIQIDGLMCKSADSGIIHSKDRLNDQDTYMDDARSESSHVSQSSAVTNATDNEADKLLSQWADTPIDEKTLEQPIPTVETEFPDKSVNKQDVAKAGQDIDIYQWDNLDSYASRVS